MERSDVVEEQGEVDMERGARTDLSTISTNTTTRPIDVALTSMDTIAAKKQAVVTGAENSSSGKKDGSARRRRRNKSEQVDDEHVSSSSSYSDDSVRPGAERVDGLNSIDDPLADDVDSDMQEGLSTSQSRGIFELDEILIEAELAPPLDDVIQEAVTRAVQEERERQVQTKQQEENITNNTSVVACGVTILEEHEDQECSRRPKVVGTVVGLIVVCLTVILLALMLSGGGRNNHYATSTPIRTPSPSPTPPPLSCGFKILEGKDLLGGDITSAIPLLLNFNDALEECRDICAALPNCDSFTLLDTGAYPWSSSGSNPVPWCFVKDFVPTDSDRDGMTSGVKINSMSHDSCTEGSDYTPLPATNLIGPDYFLPCVPLEFAESLEASYDVCQDICSAMSHCYSFTAVNPDIDPILSDFSCCIKDGVPEYVLGGEPNTYSGIKLR